MNTLANHKSNLLTAQNPEDPNSKIDIDLTKDDQKQAFVEKYDDFEDEDDNLVFKEKPSSEKPEPEVNSGVVATIQEVEIKGVHFKLCCSDGNDCKNPIHS